MKCLKSTLKLNKIGDKCYGSTTGSNPVSVGSTPTSLANFWRIIMYAIKVTPNKRKPDDFFLMRDLEDFVVHVWSRKTEAEKALARMDNPICELTQDIPRAALERAMKKKQRVARTEA